MPDRGAAVEKAKKVSKGRGAGEAMRLQEIQRAEIRVLIVSLFCV
jgi:hypothetical protein